MRLRCVGSWVSNGENISWEGVVDGNRDWVVIADGMGGHDAGELASESVIRAIVNRMSDARSEIDVAHMLDEANDEIYQQMYSSQGRSGMGSTVVGLIFLSRGVLLFNVGDSRLYVTRGDKLNLESTDDTLARMLPKQKVRSHALTQSLGGSPIRIPFTPHIKRKLLSGRDGILLCSDGLTDMLSDEEIAGILSRKPPHPAQALVSAALDAGGSDNVTVVVVATAVRVDIE